MTPWPLSIAFPLTLCGALVLVVGFDAAAAWLTRRSPATYRRVWPAQFALYVLIGYVAMLATLDLRRVEVIGAVTGFVEATLGWTITTRIGPGRVPNATPLSAAAVVFAMTAFAFGLAIVGALLFNVTARVLMHAR